MDSDVAIDSTAPRLAPPAQSSERVVAFVLDVVPMIVLEFVPVVGAVFATAYLLFRDSLFGGQSFGKKLLKTRVVRLVDGQGAGVRESILRNFPLALNFLLPIIPVVGHLLGAGTVSFVILMESIALLTDRRGRRLGDKLAGTLVVSEGRTPRAQHG